LSSNQRKWLTPLLLILVATFIAGVMIASRPETAKIEVPERRLAVDIAVVQQQDLRIPIQAQGTVTPYRETAVVAEVSGKVIEVSPNFYAGGYIAKGELLLRIDDVEHQANLNRAEAALATAESNLAQEQGRADVALQEFKKFPGKQRTEAAQALYLRKPQLKQAQAQLLSAQADLRKARHDLDRTVIRAPYNSLIKQKQSDLGLYLTPGTPVATIFAIDFAEVRLAIPQSKLAYLDLPEVRDNIDDSSQYVPSAVDLYTSVGGELKHWQARLNRTEGVYDERSRVLFTVARIDDPYLLKPAPAADASQADTPLRMGTFVSAVIEGRLIKNLVVLPRNILHAGELVWVVDAQDTLRNRKVSTLRTQGDEIYVTSGLQNGDRVCLTLLNDVVAGSAVEIVSTTSTDQLFNKSGHNTPGSEVPVPDETLLLPDVMGPMQGSSL
jgi:RND family efflux transporter MFP subunit